MHPFDASDLSVAKFRIRDLMFLYVTECIICSQKPTKNPTNTAFITQKINITRYELTRPDERHNVRYADDLYSLAKFLMSSFSNEISYTKLKNTLNFRSVNTVQSYVRYLEDTYLIFHLDMFSFKQREQIKSPKKMYVIDTGMANAVSFKFSEDIGNMMENTVAVELLRQKSNSISRIEVYYWKDTQHREIDFVIKEGPDISQLIQVCYNINDLKTRKRELRSLVGAAKELNCNNLLVITWDYDNTEEYNGNSIRYVPLWKWLQK